MIVSRKDEIVSPLFPEATASDISTAARLVFSQIS